MKTLSLTNLDRITELDFDRTSSANAVGGRLSISKFKNLTKLKASYNDLSKVTFSTSDNTTVEELNLSNNLLTSISNVDSLTGLETVDLSNNGLSILDVDHVLTALDTNGKTNGNVQLGGTNSLPTRGNYNTAKLSLENKGWTVGIAGGIDSSFTSEEGYSSGNTFSHPDWEGGLVNGTGWQNDPANGKITTSTQFRSIRTVNPIRARVGDTVDVSITFDYGDNALEIDDNPPGKERTFLVALADIGTFVQGETASTLLNGSNIALMTKFESQFNNPSNPGFVKLYQKYNTGNTSLQEVVGSNPNALSLSGATGDKFTLTFQIKIGATKETSTVNVSLNNDEDGNLLSGSYTLANYSSIYSSLISSTSTVKLHMQSGELDDTNINEINVYNVSARVTSTYDINIDWDLTGVPVTSYDPDGNVNDRPRINTFREDSQFIQYLNAGGIYVDATTGVQSVPPWGDRSTGSFTTHIPLGDAGTLNAGVDVFVDNSMTIELQPPASNWTVTSSQSGETQYQLLFTTPGTKNINVKITDP